MTAFSFLPPLPPPLPPLPPPPRLVLVLDIRAPSTPIPATPPPKEADADASGVSLTACWAFPPTHSPNRRHRRRLAQRGTIPRARAPHSVVCPPTRRNRNPGGLLGGLRSTRRSGGTRPQNTTHPPEANRARVLTATAPGLGLRPTSDPAHNRKFRRGHEVLNDDAPCFRRGTRRRA